MICLLFLALGMALNSNAAFVGAKCDRMVQGAALKMVNAAIRHLKRYSITCPKGGSGRGGPGPGIQNETAGHQIKVRTATVFEHGDVLV